MYNRNLPIFASEIENAINVPDQIEDFTDQPPESARTLIKEN